MPSSREYSVGEVSPTRTGGLRIRRWLRGCSRSRRHLGLEPACRV